MKSKVKEVKYIEMEKLKSSTETNYTSIKGDTTLHEGEYKDDKENKTSKELNLNQILQNTQK